MMDGMSTGVVLGMGLFCLLIVILVILAVAALTKYLFFDKRSGAVRK